MFSLCLIVGHTIFSKAVRERDHFHEKLITTQWKANKYSNRFIHILTFICDFEPLCEIQTECLCAIGENMEGDLETIPKTEIRDGLVVDLRTLPLHVSDEPLEECGSFNLVDNVST